MVMRRVGKDAWLAGSVRAAIACVVPTVVQLMLGTRRLKRCFAHPTN